MCETISVIIPVYNTKKYLGSCINSVLNQTYTNLEILLIDDGSSDGSEKICDYYATVDSRIIVYHKENGGLSDARNYGLDRARGDFIAFVDSDDVINIHFFERLMKTQRETDADVVSCDIIRFINDSEFKHNEKYCESKDEMVIEGEGILIEYFSKVRNPIIYHGLCMKIYKKNVFYNLRFDKGRLHEDVFITHKILSVTKRFVMVFAPYYGYRNNSESICNTYNQKNFIDECEALFVMDDYFKDSNVYNCVQSYLIKKFYLQIMYWAKYIDEPMLKDLIDRITEWVNINLNESDINRLKKILIYITFNGVIKNALFRKIIMRAKKCIST